MAHAITHCGMGPACLSPCVVQYFVGGLANIQPTVDDVPDKEVASMLNEVGFTQRGQWHSKCSPCCAGVCVVAFRAKGYGFKS